jgi:hypothetical protein
MVEEGFDGLHEGENFTRGEIGVFRYGGDDGGPLEEPGFEDVERVGGSGGGGPGEIERGIGAVGEELIDGEGESDRYLR